MALAHATSDSAGVVCSILTAPHRHNMHNMHLVVCQGAAHLVAYVQALLLYTLFKLNL